MNNEIRKTVAVIVAHPDDETLWAGGTILSNPSWNCFIVCLCRASDKDRSARFSNALNVLKSKGVMGDLDDGPEQKTLGEKEMENAIMQLLPTTHFDLIITHNSTGEYTRHRRHEDTNKAVVKLLQEGKITTNELRTFAYEDGNKAYFPKAIDKANIFNVLSEQIWLRKYSLITEIYGYKKNSWEAETTPSAEAFWQFKAPHYNEVAHYNSESHQFKESHYNKNTLMKFTNELKIFKTSNLQFLKSLYYKSKAYVSDLNSWELKTTEQIEAFWQFKNRHNTKKTLKKISTELNIFRTSSVDNLKKVYYETMMFVKNKRL